MPYYSIKAEQYQERAHDEIRQLDLERPFARLDWFLALTPDQRQAVWRGWDDLARRQTVNAQMIRKGWDWNEDLVTDQVAHYNALWGDQPLPGDDALTAAASTVPVPDGVMLPASVINPHASHPTPLACIQQAPAEALVSLQAAFVMAHAQDAGAIRAAQRLTLVGPIQSFDGIELRVQSGSGRDAEYVTDGQGCTCPGGRHPWCKHRVLFRLLLAQRALIIPQSLLQTIAAQTPPQRVQCVGRAA